MTMEGLRATLSARALPAPDNAALHYWKSAAEGKLVLQRCLTCGRFQFYPRALCAACAGETEWVEASGRGTLYTFTVIRQNHAAAFAGLGRMYLDDPRFCERYDARQAGLAEYMAAAMAAYAKTIPD